MSIESYLAMWDTSLSSSNFPPLKKRVSVIGEENRVLGPMISKAGIELTVEPADRIELKNLVSTTDELTKVGFPTCIVMGLFDVLSQAESGGISRFRIVLEKAHYDTIHSSKMAFREAARNAARKILDAV